MSQASGLDFRHMQQTVALLSSLQGKKTVFMVTHNQELIACCGWIMGQLLNGILSRRRHKRQKTEGSY